MAKSYDYRTTTNIISGGYPGETVGVIPDDTSWHNTSNMSGSHEVVYHYRDSNSSDNWNSTRVKVTVRDEWSASIDNKNYLTVNVSSTITSIIRDDLLGNPHAGGTARRNIYISRYSGGPVLWSTTNDPINTNHTIATNINLGTYSFTLEPGQMASRAVIYYKNCLPGHENDPLPNIYTDILAMGTEFRNPLPKDYRPGMIWDGNTWQSHNRNGGWDGIWDGTSYREMRTDDGGTGTGNSPSILHENGWRNQRLIGDNQ